MGFWITWALIPVVVEIFPAIISGTWLLIHNWRTEKLAIPEKLPLISLIVPVYNSEATLFKCIRSIAVSTYPKELIQIILADNQSTDDSFLIYDQAQKEFPDLNIQLIRTEKGKAKALNAAVYSSIGTYIINIDSDGALEKKALMNMVLQFENNPQIAALTGVILPEPEMVKEKQYLGLALLQRNEFFEYAQAFLAGRSIESRHNQLFTMSGAFSAFRRSYLLDTFLYNTETIGEDTDMTFQIRERLNDQVVICTKAIFFIEPIKSLDNLYRQRQRWQRGEIEVVQQYNRKLKITYFFKNFLVRRMLIDHTFLFPKMIWLFASLVLVALGYSWKLLLLSYLVIYLLYVFVGALNYICVLLLLRGFSVEKKFFAVLWWVALTLPFYNFICSWIRFIGILNSMTQKSSWNALTFNEEFSALKLVLKKDLQLFKKKVSKKGRE
ncbi:TIGR03111 family XrtG-associated glycosyltransferase [Liquorilactobacillus nagelii]|jgi:putative glycosyltransferase (exosortase G-associated)|uniref:TIGR03111 family XrtG-associated glycosyltransferase n=1 Tax=Liquorilactobacillus nagelii TaxID=82688 RepID=UPI0006F057E4|nr:glycosyltransferase [Liquorilactobacillus nagelii DSM 13675]